MSIANKYIFFTGIFLVVFALLGLRVYGAETGIKSGEPGTAIEQIRIELEETHRQDSATALVTDIRHWSNPDYTRIAVTLDKEAVFEHHRLKKDPSGKLPPRLYLDIKGARIARGVKDVPIGDGLLRMARVAQYRPDVVRVVLDIDTIRDFKIFPLSDPYRVIIDVKGDRKTEISKLDDSISAYRPVQESENLVQKKEEERTRPVTAFKPGKIRRIVVDPGHGGHDPGAVGADGLKEKDVVLEMGLKLAKRIRENLGIDVVMTRSKDVFIPLEERTAIANKVNADLFVSIHANASLNKAAAGIETYYLNLAKTDKAKRVAARENNTSLEKVSMLQSILFDLMANYKINDSARLADDVQKALHGKIDKSYAGTRNLGVKQGPFYVLVGATMPSILVETAFISNETEAARLRDSEFQETTVSGIEDGIRAYVASLR
ncbi:MAG: N-acetylmuramyl-L-alanine amidase [Geobacteraceae bacterium]|nr:N-acetylmuramyl-L-alanine amidase [Geobacteraceae bacterium]